MKKLSKVLVLVLSAVMVLAMSASVFAADDGSIKVTGAIKDETYTLYKVFEATRGDGTAISYTGAWWEGENPYFAVDSIGHIMIKDAGKDASGNLSEEAVAWLKTQTAHFKAVGSPIKATGNEVQWTGLDYGYYYVTTTTGSFVSIDSTTANQSIHEKNSVPTVDKKQSATSSAYSDNPAELNVGDTVYYQVTVTNGKGSDKDIILTDVMTSGLTFNQDSIVVTKGGEPVAAANYEVTNKSDTGFKLTLKADYVKKLGETDTVIVEYNATLNANAIVDNATANNNKVTLSYSEQTQEDTVYVATYDFNLSKTAESETGTALTGAQFKLWKDDSKETEIKVAATDGGGYVLDANGEATITAGTSVNVKGLAPGTYYLEETVAPEGYNKLDALQRVDISSNGTAAVEVIVINHAGTELPGTGGIGTTIFYILGSALVIGCGIVLISRKRMQK